MRAWITLLGFLFITQVNLSAVESLKKIPYAGLVLDEIEVDGVEVSHFRFQNDKKYIVAKPDEDLSCSLQYSVDAEDLETLRIHYLVVGLYGEGPQDCVFTSIGIKDSKGTAAVKLKAPKREGIFEVRAAMGKGLTCDQAMEEWSKNTSTKTVLGFVVVRK